MNSRTQGYLELFWWSCGYLWSWRKSFTLFSYNLLWNCL